MTVLISNFHVRMSLCGLLVRLILTAKTEHHKLVVPLLSTVLTVGIL